MLHAEHFLHSENYKALELLISNKQRLLFKFLAKLQEKMCLNQINNIGTVTVTI